MGVLIISALLLGVCIRVPGFWNLQYTMYYVPYTIYSISYTIRVAVKNYGPFLGPLNIRCHIKDPNRDHSFHNHPYTILGPLILELMWASCFFGGARLSLPHL